MATSARKKRSEAARLEQERVERDALEARRRERDAAKAERRRQRQIEEQAMAEEAAARHEQQTQREKQVSAKKQTALNQRTQRHRWSIRVGIIGAAAAAIVGLTWRAVSLTNDRDRPDLAQSTPDTLVTSSPSTSSSSTSITSSADTLPALRNWDSTDPTWTAFLASVQSLDGPDRLSNDGLLGTAQGTCMTLDMGISEQEAVHLLQIDDDPWSDETGQAWVDAAQEYLC